MCIILAIVRHGALAAQQRTHVISGRVTTDSGVVVPAADVIVTIAPTAEGSGWQVRLDRRVSHPHSESNGRISAVRRRAWSSSVSPAHHDCGLGQRRCRESQASRRPSPPWRRSLSERSTRDRPQQLGNDGRPKAPTRPTRRVRWRETEACRPSLQGVSLTPWPRQSGHSLLASGTISAFGLGSEGNATTLNGLAFAGSDLPRDVRTTTRFRTSPWDPTIGGFSGVQAAVSLLPGGNVTSRKAHITVDAKPLQFADPVASRLGTRFSGVAIDQGGVGAYALDRLYYNFGLHVARRTTPVASLANMDQGALLRAGVSPDSAARLIQIAGSLGVPVTASGIPTGRTTSTISFIERIDRASVASSTIPAPTLALTGFGSYSSSDAVSLSPTIAPAYSGKTASGLIGTQLLYSRFYGQSGDYVNETTSGFTLATTDSRPYANMPAASVFGVSDDGIGSLSLGGNSALANNTRDWTWETINQTGFLLAGRQAFPMKVYLQSRFEDYSHAMSVNRLGRFTYASLNDLSANRPSSYSRTLDPADRSVGEWIGAGAIGGNWIGDKLTISGGARVDASALTSRLSYNPNVDGTFGLRTDHVPDGVSISPRLGFVWRYTPTVGYVSYSGSGAAVNRGLAQLRGGIGKFRGVLSPASVANTLTFSGLPSDGRQLFLRRGVGTDGRLAFPRCRRGCSSRHLRERSRSVDRYGAECDGVRPVVSPIGELAREPRLDDLAVFRKLHRARRHLFADASSGEHARSQFQRRAELCIGG